MCTGAGDYFRHSKQNSGKLCVAKKLRLGTVILKLRKPIKEQLFLHTHYEHQKFIYSLSIICLQSRTKYAYHLLLL